MNSGLGTQMGLGRLCLAFLLVLPFGGGALAQGPASSDDSGKANVLSDAPSASAKVTTPAKTADARSSHRFWDRENAMLFAGVGASRALDYASTRNMQRRGREEILLPDDVVNNTAAFVAVEAGAAATSIGISYLLHRTGHHTLERWLSIGHIGVTTFGAARNYALDTKR